MVEEIPQPPIMIDYLLVPTNDKCANIKHDIYDRSEALTCNFLGSPRAHREPRL
jgi:hypothetical protein